MSEQAPIAGALLAALSAALVHLVWQGSLVGALHAAFRLVDRGSSPAARHAHALAGLLALLVCFGATMVFTLRRLVLSPAQLFEAQLFVPERLVLPSAGLESWVVGAWGCGVALLALRSGLGFWGVRQLRSSAEALDEIWSKRLARLAREIGVRGRIRVAGSRRIDVPLLLGWAKPLVLLPAAALARVPADALEAALAHELAHLRRRDHLVSLLLACMESLFFFHPVTWWLSREIRETREMAADDLVVDQLGNPEGYARSLAMLEAARSAPQAMTLAATGGELMMRIQRLVRPSSSLPGASRGGPLLLSCVLMLALALGASALAGSGELSITWLPEEVLRHRALIEASAVRHGIDADLLAIVMLLESKGNPNAESWMGALGLMQVMPATAEKIAKVRGLPVPTREELLDPATNIDMGAWYLAQQARSFAPSGLDVEGVRRIAAAYNAGPGLMRRHLEEGAELTDESIRYSSAVARLWERREESSPGE